MAPGSTWWSCPAGGCQRPALVALPPSIRQSCMLLPAGASAPCTTTAEAPSFADQYTSTVPPPATGADLCCTSEAEVSCDQDPAWVVLGDGRTRLSTSTPAPNRSTAAAATAASSTPGRRAHDPPAVRRRGPLAGRAPAAELAGARCGG